VLSYLGRVLFVLHAIDKPGALDIRQGSRPDHLEHLAKYEIPIAGPLLDDEGNMAGSCIFLDVEDLAAAQAFADQDPYAIAGLFESVSIKEFTKVIWP
jgi:uncharacterized protein YciI